MSSSDFASTAGSSGAVSSGVSSLGLSSLLSPVSLSSGAAWTSVSAAPPAASSDAPSKVFTSFSDGDTESSSGFASLFSDSVLSGAAVVSFSGTTSSPSEEAAGCSVSLELSSVGSSVTDSS